MKDDEAEGESEKDPAIPPTEESPLSIGKVSTGKLSESFCCRHYVKMSYYQNKGQIQFC